ncbi:MAG: septation ring formation regulator EzrA [Turicibacter sp.]|nr:septation ring formation regulator EzrA [Turicibacter sp.]
MDYRVILLSGISMVLAVLLCYLVLTTIKKKKYYQRIDEVEELSTDLFNVPVPFELAKLRSTKKSSHIITLVNSWEKRWKALEEQFVTVTENLIYAEECASNRQFDEVEDLVDSAKVDIDTLSLEIDTLMDEIQSLKKSEERSRSNILGLKKKFEGLKEKYEDNGEAYDQVEESIKDLFKEIETRFFKFNDYMEECNYDFADEAIVEIGQALDVISTLFERLPLYQSTLDSTVRPLLKDVLASYNHMASQGVYLSHLQIEEAVKAYREDLNQIPGWLRHFDFKKIEELLMHVEDTAKQMLDYIKREVNFQESITNDLGTLKQAIDFLLVEGEKLAHRYENIKENAALSADEEEAFLNFLGDIKICQNERLFLLAKVEGKQTPNSTLYQEMNRIMLLVEHAKTGLGSYAGKIEELYAGEKKCRYRALGLLKHLNKLRGQYKELNVPQVNEDLEEAVARASRALQSLFETIGRTPINLQDIDGQLTITQKMVDEASAYLEMEIQQSKLAEKLIVYGQRYVSREGMYLVDLTIAEDQFRNGRYKNVIETMKKILGIVEGSRFDVNYYQFKQELGCHLL